MKLPKLFRSYETLVWIVTLGGAVYLIYTMATPPAQRVVDEKVILAFIILIGGAIALLIILLRDTVKSSGWAVAIGIAFILILSKILFHRDLLTRLLHTAGILE